MKVQFEIKEKIPEIIEELYSSDNWEVKILEERGHLKRLVIIDPLFDSKARIEIWENEIHIRTAWSDYTYRIFMKGNSVMCEYIGAYRGLLEQFLLPTITPSANILETEVLDTSISGAKKETLRQYGIANLQLRQQKGGSNSKNTSKKDHPSVVYDEFIKEGILMPSPSIFSK